MNKPTLDQCTWETPLGQVLNAIRLIPVITDLNAQSIGILLQKVLENSKNLKTVYPKMPKGEHLESFVNYCMTIKRAENLPPSLKELIFKLIENANRLHIQNCKSPICTDEAMIQLRKELLSDNSD